MPGIDSFTKLMLHCNGNDGSTTFTDDSDSGHSDTAVNQAQIDTAQSKFGGACGLFDGSVDYVEFPDSPDWDFGTNDMAMDCWVRFATLSGSQCIIARPGAGTYLYWALEGGAIRFRDFNSGIDFARSPSLAINTWYHFAITRSGSNFRFFVDGIQQGATYVNASAFLVRSATLQVGGNSGIGYWFNGWIDEVRISNGDSRWTSNFTPPTQEYTSDDIIVNANVLTITSGIKEPTIKIDTIVTPNVLSIQSTIQEPTVGQVVTITPNVLTISSSIKSPTEKIDILVEPPVLTIQSTLNEPIFPVQGSLIGKIISVNPLIAVTDTNPVQIIKIDTTDPENLVYTSITIPNISNSLDVTVNSANDYVYVAGDSGKVVKVEIADLTNQTTFDLSDTDNILTVEHNTNYGITYAGTDNNTGELYTIDERTTFLIDSDFTCLAPQTFKLDSAFNIVNAFKLDSNFNALSYQFYKMNSDFKCLTKELTPITSVDDVEPIKLEDFQVFINNVELEDTDLILNSISITHSVGEESSASFRLTRKHDQLNTTLDGVSSTITNQNIVEIKCKGITIFPYNGEGTGRISELDCQYQNDTEFVIVNALSEEATNKFNKITMSLPGTDSRLSLYDVLIQNPVISNPYVDPENEENPKKYKGIKVDLGIEIEQHVVNARIEDTGTRNIELIKTVQTLTQGQLATRIQDGSFNSDQNFTYFWGCTVWKIGITDFITNTANIGYVFPYIGTSLAPISEDLWQLVNADYWTQRIYPDTETGDIYLGESISPGYIETTQVEVETEQLIVNTITWGDASSWQKVYEYKTYYYIGEAPFKEIKSRNGKKITKPYFADEPSLLVSKKDAGYDFTQYAKTVADLEYEILKNINGDILPDTKCSLNLTIDAYLYYQLSLLTRINIDNTTQANIYENSNGFPVSTKSITITSSDRRVNIEADNKKSNKEIEVINSQFPDEDDEEYNEQARKVSIFGKSSLRTLKDVE